MYNGSGYFTTTYYPSFYYGSSTGGETVANATFIFKQDTNIYVSKSDQIGADNTNTVLLNVKDFSFNVNSITEEVYRETIDANQPRGVKPFISAITPVEFTFTTYMSPLDGAVFSPEEYFWVSLMGQDIVDSGSSSKTIDFANGNVKEAQNLTIWFNNPFVSKGSYRLSGAVIDSARISLGLGEITEIQWSGRALTMFHDTGTPSSYIDATVADNCLMNKLSVITTSVNGVNYNLALTGGNIEINNNNIFYGRIKMGKVTTPAGSYTGRRTITGNLDFYMKTGSNGSIDLFNSIFNNIKTVTYEDTHFADINISIGGNTIPNVEFNIPQAIFNLGRQDFGEIFSVSVPFSAKEESGKYVSVTYQY